MFGQRDLTQTAANEVVGNRVFHPAGVVVDTMPTPTPSRLYVWDSGNNRILGFDHIGRCRGGPLEEIPCTESSACAPGTCVGLEDKGATLVLGQPTVEGHAACNGDNTREAPATAQTLCAIPFPNLISPLEGPRSNSMAVDATHSLYVVDPFNNRVLRFDDPFSTDQTADAVWGQVDFTSRRCNRGRSSPDADTLCTGELDRFYPNYYFSAGLDVSADGQVLWVADLGNHRVLRIPTASGRADVVLGQPDSTSQESGCENRARLDRLCKPNAVRHDPVSDLLYVLDGDASDARLLIFEGPFFTGKVASGMLEPPEGAPFFWPRGLTRDPTELDALWVSDVENSRLLQYVRGVPSKVLSKPDFTTVGCIGGMIGDGELYPQVCGPQGSVGVDRDGSVYVGDLQAQDLARFPAPIPLPGSGMAHSPDARLVSSGTFTPNRVGGSGFWAPGDLLLVEDQLVVTDDKRILVWDDFGAGALSGGSADHVLGAPDLVSPGDEAISHGRSYRALAHDATRRLLYAAHGPYVTAWATAGGVVSHAPVFQVSCPVPVRGGSATTFEGAGIAIDETHDAAWVSDRTGGRLLRIVRFSRPEREVDLVLGQESLSAGGCNRGAGPSSPGATTFCSPTQVTFDRRGNLFVVDSDWEGGRNQRVLEFDAAALPAVPAPDLLLSLPASRVFAKASMTAVGCDPDTVNQPCTPMYVSFERGTNRMALSVDSRAMGGFKPPASSRRLRASGLVASVG